MENLSEKLYLSRLVKMPEGMILDDSKLNNIRDFLYPITKCSLNHAVELVNNSRVYGRSYGDWPYMYLCQQCDSYVGVHTGTVIPLGTLADKETREARKVSKSKFFKFVKSKLSEGYTRSNCYEELAKLMNIPKNECHFGMFDIERCNLAYGILEELGF